MFVRFIAFLLMWSLLFSHLTDAYAKTLARHSTSISFVFVKDGNADKISQDLARELAFTFLNTQDYAVVQPKFIEQALLSNPIHFHHIKKSDEEEKIKQAKEHYYFYQFSQAESLLLSLLNQAHVSTKTLLQTHLLLALVYKAQNKENEMRLSFQKVLELSKLFQLNEEMYAPSFRDAFEEERKKISSKKIGSVEIASIPESATVYANGIELGKTPLSLPFVPVGKHRVVVKMPGHRSKKVKIKVQANQTSQFSFRLKEDSKSEKKNEKSEDERFFLYAQRVSEFLKCSKIILLDIDDIQNEHALSALVYDKQSGLALNPIRISSFSQNVEFMSRLASDILEQLKLDPRKGDVISVERSASEKSHHKTLSKRKRKILLYSIAGAAVLGILGAFAASAGGNGGESASTSSHFEIHVNGNE